MSTYKIFKKMPLVSIHIISYNQVDFIDEAIQSALNQEYDNLEIIIADDGSTDGTCEVILEYGLKFPEIIIPLVGGPNLGITGNSNRGLAACRGKYVAFMGGDDSFLPGKISKQVEWLEADKNRVLCYHDLDVYDSESGRTLYLWSQKYRFRTGDARSLVKYGTFFGATSVMIRYSHKLNIHFNENILVASDWFMWIEILERQTGTFGYINGIFARYRRHKNNITSVASHYLHDALATIEAVEVLAPNKYKWECRQKKSEIYFLEAYKNLKLHEYWAMTTMLARSLWVCFGLWLAPSRLIFTKFLNQKI